ncbi:MAG: histidine triad nucleotide-binding protein [Anaerolineae bacterium]|nr:histidine triad nucleotide-binding protein [Anaerolineae bacterium]MDK1082401.1 histidine triad nucleotide-binding protein [Anaerolineae bacterium]
MDECIFCKIIKGDLPAKVLYKDEQVTAFHDINPVAPTHILLIPNKHIASINEIAPEDEALFGYMMTSVKKIAELTGVEKSGYRLIANTGPDANQEVFHIHFHVIGGQRMRHPMG